MINTCSDTWNHEKNRDIDQRRTLVYFQRSALLTFFGALGIALVHMHYTLHSTVYGEGVVIFLCLFYFTIRSSNLMLCKAKNKNNYMDCTNSLYNLQNHCSFHPEKRLVNLERRRGRFVGLSISNSLCLRP